MAIAIDVVGEVGRRLLQSRERSGMAGAARHANMSASESLVSEGIGGSSSRTVLRLSLVRETTLMRSRVPLRNDCRAPVLDVGVCRLASWMESESAGGAVLSSLRRINRLRVEAAPKSREQTLECGQGTPQRSRALRVQAGLLLRSAVSAGVLLAPRFIAAAAPAPFTVADVAHCSAAKPHGKQA
jgi:hypothetical protein